MRQRCYGRARSFGQGCAFILSGLWGEQDTERGRQASINTLLAEVSERAFPKPSREEAERLKQEVSHPYRL